MLLCYDGHRLAEDAGYAAHNLALVSNDRLHSFVLSFRHTKRSVQPLPPPPSKHDSLSLRKVSTGGP
jgi:hypothetical protein